jgi:Cu-Zn family superoxide dismutase
MLRTLRFAMPAVISFALLAGCDNMPWSKKKDGEKQSSSMSSSSSSSSSMSGMNMKTAVARISPSRAATTQPANNNVTGTVTFMPTNDGVKVAINLNGFAPNSTHGFHIHEKGDLSDPALMSAGGHFNPEGHKHGGPQSAMAHAGDLGNVTADANGNVNTEMTVRGLTLDNGRTGIVGRSVLVHGGADDLKTDPAGNSGPRIAGGVIEMK